jgi:hypothetical protein
VQYLNSSKRLPKCNWQSVGFFYTRPSRLTLFADVSTRLSEGTFLALVEQWRIVFAIAMSVQLERLIPMNMQGKSRQSRYRSNLFTRALDSAMLLAMRLNFLASISCVPIHP